MVTEYRGYRIKESADHPDAPIQNLRRPVKSLRVWVMNPNGLLIGTVGSVDDAKNMIDKITSSVEEVSDGQADEQSAGEVAEE